MSAPSESVFCLLFPAITGTVMQLSKHSDVSKQCLYTVDDRAVQVLNVFQWDALIDFCTWPDKTCWQPSAETVGNFYGYTTLENKGLIMKGPGGGSVWIHIRPETNNSFKRRGPE